MVPRRPPHRSAPGVQPGLRQGLGLRSGRVADGRAVTLTARSRNTAGYQRLLEAVEAANPTGDVYVVADNLTSHASKALQEWLVDHPRIVQAFIPKGACWLNLIEAWWRTFRRTALAGQSNAFGHEIDQAARVATAQLNRRAQPWVWGRPPKPPRRRRRRSVYRL